MKNFTPIFLFSSLIFASSCGQLLFDRSYLSEMGHDDSRMFEPAHDFPVVGGDTGSMSMSDQERQERTPASIHDIEADRNRQALKEELRTLEGRQPERAFEFYDRHKSKLGTVSDRIFFLKLPHSERKDYLLSRGIISEEHIQPISQDRPLIRKTDVFLGMSKDAVRENWGKPVRVEIAGNPSYENERWLYNMNGATKYIYFESGLVGGWE